MKIGYARLGRILTCDPQRWGVVGGDVEPPRLLDTLARRHPEDEFHLLGRTAPELPQDHGLPDNVVNPWLELDDERRRLMSKAERNGAQLTMDMRSRFVSWVDQRVLPLWAEMDAVVVWLGQHGSVHAPGIPKTKGSWAPEDLVTPQDWAVLYGAPVIRGINMFRKKDPREREEVWLISDARNYLKAHDLKWPLQHPILGQYNFERDFWVQRYTDERSPAEAGWSDMVKDRHQPSHHWKVGSQYTASGLEICGVLPQHVDVHQNTNFDRPDHFGLFINEARATSGVQRADVVRDWIRPLTPDWIHGKWTDKGLATACTESIVPLEASGYFEKLRDTRCTFTTPSSGSGWATTKPWEAFAVGTVCFRHPGYDTQDHVYGKLPQPVRDWLSPPTVRDLYARLEHLRTDDNTWRWLATEQRKAYDTAAADLSYIRMIEDRIWK